MPRSTGFAPALLTPSESTRRTRLVGWLLVAVAAVVFLRTEVITPLRVVSESMSPTLQSNDQVLIDRLHLAGDDIERNDLVVFRSPAEGELSLKRVVGIGGDEVAILDGWLYVNDELVVEPYVEHEEMDGIYYGTVTVPADELLVLGDNRANSIDSRNYGTVPVDLVQGQVLFRLWPLG